MAEAYQHCMRIAQQHYENFPTASKLISPELRPAVAAIYAFARSADDMADEGDAPNDKRLKQIDAWDSLLERCVVEEIDHPVFLALGDAIKRFNLPIEELHKLLIAFRMDVSIHSYATFDELTFYCKHSANPVGRLMLALHGIHDSRADSYSDAICTALQLANFWQDLSVDIPRGRCYMPEEWLKQADLISVEVLEKTITSDRIRPALDLAINRTGQLFDEGTALLSMLPFRFRLQIAATLVGGRSILAAVKDSDDPMRIRPKLQRSDWKRLAFGTIRMTLFPPGKATS